MGSPLRQTAAAFAAALAFLGADSDSPGQPPPPVVLAAGDIAGCDTAGDEETAALLDELPGTVLALGDLAYTHGTADEFRRCFEPTWGRHKARIRPTPGNHDYALDSASGYFDYFGPAAGPARRGYYSFDLGTWHIVSLNSERERHVTGRQVRWLKRDLRRSNATCILAFWHRPRWSAGRYGDDVSLTPIWNTLYDAGADVVLTAHDHNYQRYPPMNKRGRVDRLRGIRSFVVGTGGRPTYPVRRDSRRDASNDRAWGLLRLTLRPRSYMWRFEPTMGDDYRDSGTGACSPRRR